MIRKLPLGVEPPLELLLLADPSENKIKDYLNQGTCFVFIKEKETLGAYVLAPVDKNIVEIMNVAVEESEQGKGIGKLLILDAIERAKQAGYKRIEIGTGNSSIGQLALYQKCGFRLTSIEKDYFTKNYSEPIIENGIRCVDRINLSIDLKS